MKTLRERLEEKIMPVPEAGCWLWTGFTDKHGYGRVGVDGTSRFSHRMIWQEVKGQIPAGLFVLHKCDTPTCCNPDHLFLGTHSDNMSDMKRKGRKNKSHCKRGHELKGDNVYLEKSGRHCRVCRNASNRRKELVP